MRWKRTLSRMAAGICIVFTLFLTLGIAASNGFVLVLSADLDAHFLAGYPPRAEPLTKLLWISFGTNGNGALIGRCPDGREKELYYLPGGAVPLPYYPVGKIC